MIFVHVCPCVIRLLQGAEVGLADTSPHVRCMSCRGSYDKQRRATPHAYNPEPNLSSKLKVQKVSLSLSIWFRKMIAAVSR